MPQCPHCQVPYEAGQRYCSTCGSFLLHPEQGDTFCPQCGVRVSPRQEFCHECDAPLKGAQAAPEALGTASGAAAPAPEAAPAKIPPSGMPSWLIGVLVGAGILVIILLILLFTRGTINAPGPGSGSQSRSAGSRPACGHRNSHCTRHPRPGAGHPGRGEPERAVAKGAFHLAGSPVAQRYRPVYERLLPHLPGTGQTSAPAP